MFQVGKDFGAPYSSYIPPPPPKPEEFIDLSPIGNDTLSGLSDSEQRSVGILLGTMVGDVLGAPVETWRPSKIIGIHGRLKTFVKGEHLGVEGEERFGMYTDDTNSTLALASSLVTKQTLDPEHIALENANFFMKIPKRGYSQHSRATLESILDGSVNYKDAGVMLFEEGSWSNGATMKISPIGFCFRNSSEEILRKAVAQALISTHVHPESTDAAFIQAKAISILVKINSQSFSPENFLNELIDHASHSRVVRNLRIVKTNLSEKKDIAITNIILNSVPEIGEHFQIRASDALACSVYAFVKHYNEPDQAVIEAVNMGGDTDTLGAITGALVGALHGVHWIPRIWFMNLENSEFGKDYAIDLGKKLSQLDLFDF